MKCNLVLFVFFLQDNGGKFFRMNIIREGKDGTVLEVLFDPADFWSCYSTDFAVVVLNSIIFNYA